MQRIRSLVASARSVRAVLSLTATTSRRYFRAAPVAALVGPILFRAVPLLTWAPRTSRGKSDITMLLLCKLNDHYVQGTP
ncbi:hypothetical protein GCM10027271_49870 [Saccharopolyspora gloriosae]